MSETLRNTKHRSRTPTWDDSTSRQVRIRHTRTADQQQQQQHHHQMKDEFADVFVGGERRGRAADLAHTPDQVEIHSPEIGSANHLASESRRSRRSSFSRDGNGHPVSLRPISPPGRRLSSRSGLSSSSSSSSSSAVHGVGAEQQPTPPLTRQQRSSSAGVLSRLVCCNRRKVADRLSLRWRVLGGCGICCLALSTLTLLVLSNPNLLMSESSGGGRGRRSGNNGNLPEWFNDRPLPHILATYVDTHNRAVNSPLSRDSRFLIHEIPKNETQIVDTLLGLVSSFMLAVVTDRALLVEWTDGWATPLDQLSQFKAPTSSSSSSLSGGGGGKNPSVPSFSSSSSAFSSAAADAFSSSGAFGGLTGGGGGSSSSSGANDPLYDDDDGDDDADDDDGASASSSSSSTQDGSGSGGVFFNESATLRARRVGLADALVEPGIRWDLNELMAKYRKKVEGGGIMPGVFVWDPGASVEDVSCKDLKQVLGPEHKFVKVSSAGISGSSYYMPLLLINPFYSEALNDAFSGGVGWAFADMLNFLVRPVAEIQDAIHRFQVRYMDGNTVIGLEMAVMPGRGDWAGSGLMPLEQQNLFFSTASAVVDKQNKKKGGGGGGGDTAGGGSGGDGSGSGTGNGVNDDGTDYAAGSASTGGTTTTTTTTTTTGGGASNTDDKATKGVVFLLVTDNQAQIQERFHELEAADQVTGAGVVAILAASGDGAARVHLELQELWMLGLADVALTTPGSRMGIVGAARTHKQPLVVVSETSVHTSSAPYPCFAQFGAIQHTTCFVPSMLSRIPPDALVPC